MSPSREADRHRRMDEVRRLLDAAPGPADALPALRQPPTPAPTASAPAHTPMAPLAPASAAALPALALPVGLAAGLLAVAGIIHLVLLPQHLEAARGIGLYFCAIGAAQVVWALLYVLRPTRRLAWIGLMALAIQPIAVYVLTRVARQPFGDGSEPVDLIGLLTCAMELAALAPFGIHLARTRAAGMSAGRGVAVPLAVGIAVGLLFGAALYGAGLVAEDLVPWLDEPESAHGHAHAEADLASAMDSPATAAEPHDHSHG